MIERRQHPRRAVDYLVNLRHPLLGSFTARVADLSIGGLSLTFDEDSFFFIMMELEVRIQGDGWDESMPPLTAQVIRIDGNRAGLKFPETTDDFWSLPVEREFDMLWSEIDELVFPL